MITDWHTTQLRIDLDTRWIKQNGKKKMFRLRVTRSMKVYSSQLVDPSRNLLGLDDCALIYLDN